MSFSINVDSNYIRRFELAKFSRPVKREYSYFDVVDSEFIKKLSSIKKFRIYKVLTEEGRPDLLSERIYGSGETQFWWILMLLNGLRLPKDLKTGMQIRYPEKHELENIYMSLGNSPDSGLGYLNREESDEEGITKIERIL